MKKALSLLLAAAMMASLAAPVAYADDTLPAAEPAAVEQPAEEETADNPQPEEPTPAPEETTAPEETPAPTEEPAAEEPTPVPTEEPTPAPETTEAPAEETPVSEETLPVDTLEVSTSENAATVTNDTVVLHYDPESKMLFGKVPVNLETNEYGDSQVGSMDIYTIDTGTGETRYAIGANYAYMDGAYWVFYGSGLNSATDTGYDWTQMRVVYTDTVADINGSETANHSCPIILSSETASEKPSYMISETKYLNLYNNTDEYIEYDKDYTVSYDSASDTDVSFYGVGGIEVISVDTSARTITYRFTSGHKYAYYTDYKNGSPKTMGYIACICKDASNDSAYYFAKETPSYTPNTAVYVNAYSNIYWADIISADGTDVTPYRYLYNQSMSVRSWDFFGEVDADKIDAYISNWNSDSSTYDYYPVQATYSADVDVINLKIAELPKNMSNAELNLWVPYTNGQIAHLSTNPSKKYISAQVVSDSLTTSEKAGSVFTGTLYKRKSNGEIGDLAAFGDDATITISHTNGMNINSSDYDKYFKLEYDNTTSKVTVTVLQDLPLTTDEGATHALYFTVEDTFNTTDSIGVNFGAPSLSFSGNYLQLIGDEGQALRVYTTLNGKDVRSWNDLGTLDTSKDITAKMTYTVSGSNTKIEVPMTARYDATDDAVYLHFNKNDLPVNEAKNVEIFFTVPYKEYDVTATSSLSGSSWISMKMDNDNLAPTKGSSLDANVTYNLDGKDKPVPSDLSGMTWQLTEYNGAIQLQNGEALSDYISVAMTGDGKLHFEVLKDIVFADGLDSATVTVKGGNTYVSFDASLNVGVKKLNVAFFKTNSNGSDEQVSIEYLNVGQSLTVMPYIVKGYYVKDQSLQHAGYDYEPVIYVSKGSSDAMWNSSTAQVFTDADKYFTVVKNQDGSITITKKAEPPTYDKSAENIHDNQYAYILEVKGSEFRANYNNGYCYLTTKSHTLYLEKNGESVHTLPETVGTYTYDIADMPDGNVVVSYTSLPNGITVSVNAAKKQLTYTVSNSYQKQDWSQNLQVKGYINDTYRFSIESVFGAESIKLEFYNTVDNANTSVYSVSKFNEQNAAFRIYPSGNQYPYYDVPISISKLDTSKIVVKSTEDGQTVPIADSQYFATEINGDILKITFKQTPKADQTYSLTFSYEDANYKVTGSTLTYSSSSSNGSNYHELYAMDLTTDMRTQMIPYGKAGTKTSYRIVDGYNYNYEWLSKTDRVDFNKLHLVSNADIDLDQYVKVTLNAADSTITLEWLQELPKFKEDKTAYEYSISATNNSYGQHIGIGTISSPSFYNSRTNAYLEIGARDLVFAKGTTTSYYLDSYPSIDDGIEYTVTDASGNVVDPALIKFAANSSKGLDVIVSPDAKPGQYKFIMHGTVYGGKYSFAIGSTKDRMLRITEENVSYVGTNVTQYSDKNTYTFNAANNTYYPSLGYDMALDLTAAADSDIKSFTMEGLTLGTAEAIENGYRITWEKTGTETINLKAILKDGSENVLQLQIGVSRSGYNLNFRLEGADKSIQLFQGSVWTVGKEYKVYLTNGITDWKDLGYKLDYFDLINKDYYEITNVDKNECSFTFRPLKSCNITSNYYNAPSATYVKYKYYNGEQWYASSSSFSGGMIVDADKRLNFVDADTGAALTEVTLKPTAPSKTLTLNIDASNVAEVEYSTNRPNSVKWEAVPSLGVGAVKVTVVQTLGYGETYFNALVTRKDGTQTSAYVELSWNDYSSNGNESRLPDGSRITFGRKGADGSYNSYSGTSTQQGSNGLKERTYVFFSTYGNGITTYADTSDLVEKIEVTSSDPDKVQILRQGKENLDDDTYFVEYQTQTADCGSYRLKATVTLKDGSTRCAYLNLRVVEPSQNNTVTVSTSDELKAALTSAALLPGTQIVLNMGSYTGDYDVDIPVTITADHNALPELKGSITAKVQKVYVYNIHFNGVNLSGAAVTDAASVGYCSFNGYDVGIVLEKDVMADSSHSVYGCQFFDTKTAIQLAKNDYYTYITDNVFHSNDVAVEILPTCTVTGAYANYFGTSTNRGNTNRNQFYLKDGQLAVKNNAANGVAMNFTYNYFGALQSDGTTKDTVPTNSMFEGKVFYVPFYETSKMDQVRVDESLDDNMRENDPENKVASIELNAAQGSTNSATLSNSTFDELYDESKETEVMEVKVKSSANETDVIWSFDKSEKNDKYEDNGTGVNLGVSFTFTDFEKDIVNNVVKQSDETQDSLNSLTYQAMCFSHSGELPGKAEVKVRMNTGLKEYYNEHGSMDGFKVYYVNEGTGQLELQQFADGELRIEQVDGVPYVVFPITHCSSYLFTNGIINGALSGLSEVILKVMENNPYIIEKEGSLRFLNRLTESLSFDALKPYLSGGEMKVLDADGNATDGNVIGTGYTIGLGADGKTGAVTAVVGGDVNGDGKITTADMLKETRAMLGMLTLDGPYLKAATTMSGNTDEPSTSDMLRLTRYMLNMVDTMYPAN